MVLATRDRSRPWHRDRGLLLMVAGLGVALFGQTLAWRGGPILLVPLGLAVALLVVSGLRADRFEGDLVGPLAGGIAVAALLSLGVHAGFGWFQPSRAIVPSLLLGGTGLMAGFGLLVRRRGLHVGRAVAGLVGATLVVGLAAWILVPPVSAGLAEFFDYMAAYTWSDIAETRSLFNAEGGVFFAPVLLLGFAFVLGLWGLGSATWLTVRQHRPGWLFVASYGWFFLFMAVVQSRFAGHYALLHSVLGGYAFVRLVATVDLARPVSLLPAGGDRDDATGWTPSLPDGRSLVALGLLFVLVFGMGFVQTTVKQSQVAIDDDTYRAGTFLEEFAADRDLTYPDNYVFSPWGRNRFFNYVVSGESFSYQYAKQHYPAFLAATNGTAEYRFLRNRTGFVVTEERGAGEFQAGAMHTRLHEHFGSRSPDAPGLEHFRAIYAAPDGARAAFQLVPGATVRTTIAPNRTVSATTTVTVPPANTSITYVRRVESGPDGTVTFVTPYPGTYEVGNATVEVPETAVEDGRLVAGSTATGAEGA